MCSCAQMSCQSRRVKVPLESIRVHCRVVCSAAPVCPPGHSRVHRPRGHPSPTATSADSASGSPARRCRTDLIPGSSSPVGLSCVSEAFVQLLTSWTERTRLHFPVLRSLYQITCFFLGKLIDNYKETTDGKIKLYYFNSQHDGLNAVSSAGSPHYFL